MRVLPSPKQCGQDHHRRSPERAAAFCEIVFCLKHISWEWKAYLIQPAVGIPRPASNGAIHDSCPEETENHRGNDTTSLKCPPNNYLDCAGTEKKLVEAKNNFRNVRVPGGGSGHNISHTKVGQVSYERSCSTTIGERITPEHPLYCDEGTGGNGLEHQGESGLSMSKSTIKKAQSRNDEIYNKSTKYEIGVVELEALVLGIDVNLQRVAAFRLGRVICWLTPNMSAISGEYGKLTVTHSC